jgi:hypothetical protein
VFDWFAVFEMLLYYFGHVLLYDAQVPGAPGVDDEVRAVFTEAEAVYAVNSSLSALRTALDPRFLQSPPLQTSTWAS